jgi:tRNA_anti-like
MKKKNIIAVTIIIFLLAAGFAGWYIFNKPHRSIDRAETLSINTDSLLAAYQLDEKSANIIYLDKALKVIGEIAELNTNQAGQMVILLKTVDPMSGVVCTLRDKPKVTLHVGQQIVLKGFCSGYITDVVLRDCQLETEK